MSSSWGTRFLLVVFACMLLVPLVTGKVLVVNSKDWRDVYLGLHYANLNGYNQTYFLMSFTDSEIVARLLEGEKDGKVTIIESVSQPQIRSYGRFLELRGFKNVETIRSTSPYDLQLELGEKLNAEKFILVRSDYGYDAISIAPYAYVNNYWVLFVNKDNYKKVSSFVRSRPAKLMLYGDLGRRIHSEFSDLKPTIVDNGDKFKDNKQIVTWFVKQRKPKMALLTTGRFIEPELMTGKVGKAPVLFLSTPEDTSTFLLKNNIKLLQINGESLETGRKIREASNKQIGVLVKYAMTYRGIPDMSGLYVIRTFEVPSPVVDIVIESTYYDKERGLLIVKYTNKGNAQGFFNSRISVVSSLRGEVEVALDDHVHSLFPGESFLGIYKLNTTLSENEEYKAYVYCLYGEAIGAMNRYVTEKGKELPPFVSPVEFTTIEDASNIEVESVDFDVAAYSFIITLRNVGDKPVFTDAEIFNFRVNNANQTFSYDNSPGFEGAKLIKPGESAVLMIDADLVESDFDRNEEVNLDVYFGENKEWMINHKVVRIPVHLRFERIILTGLYSFVTTFGWLILIAIILLVLLITRRRKRKKTEEIKGKVKERAENLLEFLGRK